MNRNQKSNIKRQEIYEEDQEQQVSSPVKDHMANLNKKSSSSSNKINQNSYEEEQEQEGEIISKSPEEAEEEEIVQNQNPIYDSSDEDQARIEEEKKKREEKWKHRNQEVQKLGNISQEDLLKKAFENVEKTNKRVIIMRKKNKKRMEDFEKLRMAQQPYLISTNTPFRGSSSEYPIITFDTSGKTYLHPNYSLKVSEMKLDHFIQKNIKEENSANYLNEVVKFENYAYQQRKKRRHNIE